MLLIPYQLKLKSIYCNTNYKTLLNNILHKLNNHISTKIFKLLLIYLEIVTL